MENIKEPGGFNDAAQMYVKLREQVAAVEREAKAKMAGLKEQMAQLETWFTLRASEEGLSTIATATGTAYWSTHNSATVADRTTFLDHCKAENSFDLVDVRASKTAVKAYIDAYGAPPPGVDFKSTRVFNLRQNHKESA